MKQVLGRLQLSLKEQEFFGRFPVNRDANANDDEEDEDDDDDEEMEQDGAAGGGQMRVPADPMKVIPLPPFSLSPSPLPHY